MNKLFKRIGTFALFIVIVWGVSVIVAGAKRIHKNYLHKIKLNSGIEIEEIEDYKGLWQETMSDILEMTIWDKYEMGLTARDNSDTDGDGLTDRQEIEVYGSNPLKESTANDLYTDLYKIQNAMDVMKYYEYKGDIQFLYNECPEVYLEASTPYDFQAVVTKSENETKFNNCQTYAQYEIYNYSGTISIDLSEILKHNDISVFDIEIYMTDGNDVRKCVFEIDSNVAHVRNKLSNFSIYQIYVTERSAISSLSVAFLNDFEEEVAIRNVQNVEGEALVISFPLLDHILKKPIRIYYEKMDDEENSEILKEEIIEFCRGYYSADEEEYAFGKHVYPKSEKRIKAKYNLLKTLFPLCDGSKSDFDKYWFFRVFFLYFSYNERLEFELGSENPLEESTSGFNVYEDSLPLGNFKVDKANMSNNEGISHLTAQMFNNEDYVVEGEQELIMRMEAASWEANDYVNSINQQYYGGKNSYVELDYSLIEEMKKYLEEGKILDVYMKMKNNKVHAVNVYGYETDSLDEDVIWFMVYDSKFPGNQTDNAEISDNGFRLKTVRREKLLGKGHTFSYEYFPLEDTSYGATSNRKIVENPLLIVMDEEWRNISPSF